MAKKDDEKQKIEIVDNNYPTSKEPKALAETIAKPSVFAFLNRRKKRQLESYNEAIKAGTELMQSLEKHAKHIDRLEDIDTLIDIDRTKRQTELLKEKMNQSEIRRKMEKQQRLAEDTELEDLESQVRKLELLEKIEKSKASIRKHQMEGREDESREKLTIEEYREKILRRIEVIAKDSREYSLKLNEEVKKLDDEMKKELENVSYIDDPVEREKKEEEIRMIFSHAYQEIQKKYLEITKK